MTIKKEIYRSVTSAAYETKYREGYGLQHPDGHVIRFHHKILEYELKMTGGKILDYGCGNGVHLRYFADNGFTPFGCDTSPTAIAQCKKRMPKYSDNFQVVETLPKITKYFSGPFDVVFSNQVLYFFNDKDLADILGQFKKLLKKGGVIFATMMTPDNYYSRFITGKERGLSRVELTGRLHETNFINFKTKQQILDTFRKNGFKKLHLGWYTCLTREDEGRTDHWMYVGKK